MNSISSALRTIGRNTSANSIRFNSSYIKTNLFQRSLLAFGSGLVAINDPHRDDMINAFGEITGEFVLPNIYKIMQNDPEGSLILRERPRITSQSIRLGELENYPDKSFGKEYFNFLKANNITPDSRKPVSFVENEDFAYVMQRYREIHDFVHCILGLKTNMLGEVTVKIFEGIQLNLPMCWLAGLFGMLRLGPKHTDLYLNRNLPWIIDNAINSKPLITVYFEKHFNVPIDELRSNLNLKPIQTRTESSQ